MREIPKANEIYRHFKGNLYRIVTLATHSETGQQLVVYQALYGDYTVYARELSMFMSRVDRKKYPDAQQEDRFVLLPQIVGQEPAAVGVQPTSRKETVPPLSQKKTTPPLSRKETAQPPIGKEATPPLSRKEAAQPPYQEAAQSAAPPPSCGDFPAPQSAPSQPLPEEAVKGQESETAEGEETALDPLLLQFLDADTYREKLNLLAALRPRITDDMINTMAVSLDVEVNDGEIGERYEALKTCLMTMERYECSRLR